MAKKETMKIKLPKSKDDLRIRHAEALRDEYFLTNSADLRTKVKFLSKMAGISEVKMWQVDAVDVMKMYMHCLRIIGQLKTDRKPASTIELDGVKYDLVDLVRPPAAFIIDAQSSNFKKDPVKLACMCYVPTGTRYADADHNDELLHPISERYEAFKEHFPLEEFICLNAFFLKKWQRSTRRYTAQLKGVMMGISPGALIRGLKSLIWSPKTMGSHGGKSPV